MVDEHDGLSFFVESAGGAGAKSFGGGRRGVKGPRATLCHADGLPISLDTDCMGLIFTFWRQSFRNPRYWLLSRGRPKVWGCSSEIRDGLCARFLA
jgi:hypothetical protein